MNCITNKIELNTVSLLSTANSFISIFILIFVTMTTIVREDEDTGGEECSKEGENLSQVEFEEVPPNTKS